MSGIESIKNNYYKNSLWLFYAHGVKHFQKNPTKLGLALENILFTINTSCVAISFAAAFLHMIFVANEIPDIVLDVAMLIIYAMGFSHIVFYKVNQSGIENLMQMINEKYTYQVTTGLETLNMKRECKIIYWWFILWGPVGFLATQLAQIDAIINGKLSIPTYLGNFDVIRTPYFQILTIIYYIGSSQAGMSFTTIDNVTLPAMIFTTQQFQMLCERIKAIHFTALYNIGVDTVENVKCYRQNFFSTGYKVKLNKLYDNNKTIEFLFQHVLTEDQKVNYEKELRKLLLECVKCHQTLINCCEEFDRILSPIWFIRSCYAAVCISVCPFYSFAYRDKSPLTSKIMAEYSLLQAFEYGLFCYFGTQLTEAAEDVRWAAYNSAWYTTNSKFYKKLMLIMILRSSKPLSIKAGKFFSLSMEAYSNILQKSFSFFTFMQNISDE